MPTVPQLVFKEWTTPSGYAPRTIQLSARNQNVLFVGCKDGSVTVVKPSELRNGLTKDQQWEAKLVVRPDVRKGAVRSICEWDKDRILVGRNDGSLDLIRWQADGGLDEPEIVTIKESGGKKSGGDSVLTVARLDGERILLSSRNGGCRILRPEAQQDPPLETECLSFDVSGGGGDREPSAGAIRFVAPLERKLRDGTTAKCWLFISERGELFSWNGSAESPVQPAPSRCQWTLGERPAAVNDIGLWRPEEARQEHKPARGAFVATDTGVYLVDLDDGDGWKDRPDGERLQLCRLSLSGMGSICTALSYTESDSFRYLWAADLSGDCHLFWDRKPDTDAYVNFRRSGLVHAESQVLVCFAWYGTTYRRPNANTEALFFGQARRNDRIVISEYGQLGSFEDVESHSQVKEDDPARIRWLLSRGSVENLRRFMEDWDKGRGLPHSRPPARDSTSLAGWSSEYERWREASAILAEFFEFLSKDPWIRRILLESLLSESAADAILKQRVRATAEKRSSEEIPKAVVEAVGRVFQTLNLSLLGVIHRHPIARERDAAYLALLRWLRNRQQSLRTILEGRDEERSFEWKPEWTARVDREIEKSVGFARKWGVYGESNAWRENLVLPLRRLDRRLKRDLPSVADLLDRLTYQILLYERQVSSSDPPVDEEPMRGRTAWRVATLELEDRVRLVAVSWNWDGIELFEFRPEDATTPASLSLEWEFRPVRQEASPGRGLRLVLNETRCGPTGGKRARIKRDTEGQSRAIHLGRVGGRPYLLASPASDPGDPVPEVLSLWRLVSSGTGGDLRPTCCANVPIEAEGESVHSLVEVAEGWLVVGFRGSRRAGRVGLLEVRADEDRLSAHWHGFIHLERRGGDDRGVEDRESGGPFRGANEIGTGEVPAEQAETNRVLSLATARRGPGEHQAIPVFIGCERGEVFRLSLERVGNRWVLPASSDAQVVVRLRSSVRALAYRETDRGVCRLFSGGEDGTIIAWQETGPPDPGIEHDGVFPAPAGRFVSVWATAERGAVSALHLLEGVELERAHGEPRGQGLQRAVLAVTREGRAVLFDDTERAGEPTDRRRGPAYEPTRIPLPGCRHGRPWLRGPSFASLVLPDPDPPPNETDADSPRPKVQLLIASDEGTIRLVEIHDPSITNSRKESYKRILWDWWSVLEGEGQRLRLGGALYRTAPAVERILVRWLIDPSYPTTLTRPAGTDGEVQPRQVPVPNEEQSWWLPRHLRPLLDLKRSWEALFPAFLPKGVRRFLHLPTGRTPATREMGLPDVSRHAKAAGLAFDRALRRAWQYDDLGLFQEICEVVLKRANFVLYDRIRRKKRFGFRGSSKDSPQWEREKRKIQALYNELFGAMERTVQRWVGAGEEKEARAQMTIVKHLVDGDTVWQLLREVECENPNLEGARPGPHSPEDAPCTAILHRRIRAVSELVFKRNPLVNLEALRAANLSLFRLCKRLSSARQEPAGSWPGRPEVQWSVFAEYFGHLVAAAVRSFGSHIELGDALAHEYSRTFALAICACPSATIRIANQMAEAPLISDPDSEDDFSQRVRRQLWLLKDLGLEYPGEVLTLFEAVARPERGVVNPVEQVRGNLPRPELARERRRKERRGGTVSPWARFGPENDYDLRCMGSLYDGVVGWFESLQEKLASDAHGIDLTRGKRWGEGLGGLDARCADLDREDTQDFYEHSRRFWKARIDDLRQRLGLADGGDPKVRAVSKGIRPEVVLASVTLAEWAKESLDDLERRYQALDIFQPEYRHFREVLLRFERVARGFRGSAAVHKSIVEGVLGHHLLEDLDEHVLELIEIAHVLDPLKVQTYLERGRPPSAPDPAIPATAESFATYLLGRSRNAESIPKNLRTLQSLLTTSGSTGEPRSLLEMVRRAVGSRWALPDGPDIQVDERKALFLGLVIGELDQNDREYGPFEWGRKRSEGDRPSLRLGILSGGDPVNAWIEVSFRIRDELCGGTIGQDAIGRLEALRSQELQEPFPPWPDRSFASHGTGLYLANLAAAVVGWKLSIQPVDRRERKVSFRVEGPLQAGSPEAGSAHG